MKSMFIEEIFENYISTHDTNYALLINGTWGSGKTYFWKFKLSKKCEEAKLKPIYLSLNGLSKIETLDYQLKIKLIPYLNKLDTKKASAITTFSKNIFNKLAEKYANFNAKDVLKDVNIDLNLFSNSVVCFDDLERCKIPLSEVLGYVNDFVEHKKLKVLFLSDEEKITNNKDENYNSIKEKLIGRVLTYKNDLNETLPLLLKKYDKIDTNFYELLNQKKELIYSYVKELQEENLRNISFYLESLLSLFSVFKKHSNYIDEVLYFTLVITIEFKNGNLISKDYLDFKGLDEINSLSASYNFSDPNQQSESEKPLQLFYNKYILKNRIRYHFYPSIYQFVLTGYFDAKRFESELQSRVPIKIPEHSKVYEQLISYHFRNLENEEFKALFDSVYEYSEKGVYSIYDYYQISIFFTFFSDQNLIQNKKEEIQKTLLNGIDIALLRGEISDSSYNNIFRFRTADDSDPLIIQKIKEAHDTIKSRGEKKETNKLIIALSNNNLSAIQEIFFNYKIKKELFEFLDPNELFDTIKLIENKTLAEFKHQLIDRYSAGNIKEFLSEDFDFLNQLKKLIISEEKVGKNYEVRSFLFKELSNALQEICTKIK